MTVPAGGPPPARQPQSQAPDSADARRRRLLELDAVLLCLESAHESGIERTTEDLVRSVGNRVPAIVPDMPITQAIDEVFRAQEPLMTRPDADAHPLDARLAPRRRPVDIALIVAYREPRFSAPPPAPDGGIDGDETERA